MVISPEPMTDLVPTQLATKGVVITQFDLESVSRLGLVKIDLLGIRGLTPPLLSWSRPGERLVVSRLKALACELP
jgi:hypothetical protein